MPATAYYLCVNLIPLSFEEVRVAIDRGVRDVTVLYSVHGELAQLRSDCTDANQLITDQILQSLIHRCTYSFDRHTICHFPINEMGVANFANCLAI